MLDRIVECSLGCWFAVGQSAGFVLLEQNPSCARGSIGGIGPSCKSCLSLGLGSGAHLTLALRSPGNLQILNSSAIALINLTSGEFFLPTEE